MKLKNVLVWAFLILTLIPITIALMLLYGSGLKLSKESYTKNLNESIHVQADYISQTIENDMIFDYRFVNRHFMHALGEVESKESSKEDLLREFQAYLERSEDKISVCILSDYNQKPVYTIGEKSMIDSVSAQLPSPQQLSGQKVVEFELQNGSYSLGIVTPVWNSEHTYVGSLVSVYDESYLFKIISSYHKIADTSTYICGNDGKIMNRSNLTEDSDSSSFQLALEKMEFDAEGAIDMQIDRIPVTGYYKSINNSPWFLAGFIDQEMIYSFTNQYIQIYVIIIIVVLFADIILSFYFSHKVVEPINGLIKVMDGYQSNLSSNDLLLREKHGYFETRYLWIKFQEMMRKIMLVSHNFEGIYQLYQSSDMGDINIDIDVKKQTIHSSKEAFKELMNGLEFTDEQCIVERFTRCFCEKDQEVLTIMFEKMRDEHLSVTREAEIYTPYLNQKWFHIVVVPMYEEKRLSRLFVQLRDISAFKKQEFATSEQARRDVLTGLYNRAGFTELIDQVLKGQQEDWSGMHGLLFIDMNYFKLVNDNLGHSAGDELLCQIGKTLLKCAGEQNIVSRFGGDEFAMFLPNTSMSLLQQMEKELEQCLVYPFQTDKISFVVSASIGMSSWNQTEAATDMLEVLLRQADAAMYQAKRDFKENMEKNYEM